MGSMGKGIFGKYKALSEIIDDGFNLKESDKVNTSKIVLDMLNPILDIKDLNNVDSLDVGEISFEIPPISDQINDALDDNGVMDTSNIMDSYLVKLFSPGVFSIILLVVLFAIHFIYFIVHSAICCCCCRPQSNDKPNILSNICFGIGIICLLIPVILCFIAISTASDLTNNLINCESAMKTEMKLIYNALDGIFNGTQTSLGGLSESLAAMGDGFVDAFGSLALGLSDSADGILSTIKDETKANQNKNPFANIINGDIAEAIKEVNEELKKVENSNAETITIDVSSVKNDIETAFDSVSQLTDSLNESMGSLKSFLTNSSLNDFGDLHSKFQPTLDKFYKSSM
jgi:gas vesicle protein